MARTNPKSRRSTTSSRSRGNSLLPMVIAQPSEKEEAVDFTKGEPMSLDDNLKAVNVDRFWRSQGYRVNCQTCTWAFEANARGYDVEATPNTSGNRGRQNFAENPESYYNMVNDPQALYDEFNSHRFGNMLWGAKAKATDVKNSIINNNPDGARGALRVQTWTGGHILNWVKENGKVTFYDAQVGKKMTISQITGGATLEVGGRTIKTKGFTELAWARLDDKEMRPEMMRSYFKERKA